MEKILSWDEVVVKHGGISAIVKKNGKITSILCGGNDYIDEVYDGSIVYYIPDRPFYKTSIDTFQSCYELQYNFLVFQKIKRNIWREHGSFKVGKIEKIDRNFKYYLASVI